MARARKPKAPSKFAKAAARQRGAAKREEKAPEPQVKAPVDPEPLGAWMVGVCAFRKVAAGIFFRHLERERKKKAGFWGTAL